MADAVSGYRPKQFTIISLDERKIDISNSILSTDYYEDITDHSISVIASVANNYDIVNELKIRGGERVIIDFETLSGDFKWSDEQRILKIYKISGLDSKKNATFFNIHLTTKEFITNETVRCKRKYVGKISSSVRTILTDVLGTDKFLDKNIEDTSNSYDFIGCMKRPFKVLQWLSTKSLSNSAGEADPDPTGSHQEKSKGTCGYFFYENIEGYNFKSVDGMVSKLKESEGSADNKEITKYKYQGKIIESKNLKDNFTIMDYVFDKNIDLRAALRVGTYNNQTIFYNNEINDFTVYNYNLKEFVEDKKLGSESLLLSEDVDENPSRIMFRLSDNGTLANIGTETSGREPTDTSKSHSRYNLLFTQSLNILVPCNVNLKVGDIIDCQFPQMNSGNPKERDPQMSGLYLIRELRHHFSANQNTTSLKLMRDSYGPRGN